MIRQRKTQMLSALNAFKIINNLEGVSFLLLLFIAMPAKHFFGYPMAVTIAGWTHGLLFIAYVVSAYRLADSFDWPDKYTFGIVAAGVIPFGFLSVNRKLARAKEANAITAV